MNDLEININLARAMGWQPSSEYATMLNQYDVFGQKVKCNEDGVFRGFDYRDPVIFTAICKRWKLSVFFNRFTCYCQPALKSFSTDTVEKAAALCVIDAVKRGAK